MKLELTEENVLIKRFVTEIEKKDFIFEVPEAENNKMKREEFGLFKFVKLPERSQYNVKGWQEQILIVPEVYLQKVPGTILNMFLESSTEDIFMIQEKHIKAILL